MERHILGVLLGMYSNAPCYFNVTEKYNFWKKQNLTLKMNVCFEGFSEIIGFKFKEVTVK